MNEFLSIETAGKLARYEKVLKDIESLKSFINERIKVYKEISDFVQTKTAGYDCCVEELEDLLEILNLVGDSEVTKIAKKYGFYEN